MTGSLALAACLAIGANADHVLAGDLAAVLPAFARLPSDTVLGWAPAPGAPRIFHRAELRRTASRLGIAADPEHDVCVERPVAPLDAEPVRAALRAQLPGAEIDLLDFSRQPAPQGALEFPLSGLRRQTTAAYWNGYVRYGRGRRFAIWAKVRVRPTIPMVVAAEDLTAGQPIRANQVRLEMPDGLVTGGLANLEDAIGKQPRRTIRAGTALAAKAVMEPPAVRRGDMVTVTAARGGARLELAARAENTAVVGQRIALLNPISRRRFWARVDGPGRASVEPEKP